MSQDAESKTHPLQKLLDNPWLLLALGLLIPFISYTAWGWLELLTITKATLP
jgi:hypothetical protein